MTDPSPEADETTLFAREWDVPWHAHLLPLGLTMLIGSLWVTSADPRMAAWALSWGSVQQGRFQSLVLHILAHGGLLHVLMNVAALLLLSGPLISRLGQPPLSWARYLYLFVGSGISGAALFLLLNRDPSVSLLGASGAIFGIVAALARVHPATGESVAINSKRTWLLTSFFLKNHLALLALLAGAALFTGTSVGLAWEAHLGGLLFGFFATPLYLARSTQHSA